MEKKLNFQSFRRIILTIMNLMIIATFLAGSGIIEIFGSKLRNYDASEVMMHLFIYMLTYILCSYIEKNQNNRREEVRGSLMFRSMLYQLMLICLISMFTWLFDGRQTDIARIMVPSSNNISMILTATISASAFIYCAFPDGMRAMTRRQHLTLIPIYILLATVLVNVFYPFLFSVDGENVYHRCKAWCLWSIIPIAYVLASFIIVLLRCRKGQNQKETQMDWYLCKALLMATCGASLQLFFYGIDSFWPFMALAMAYLYINVQTTRYQNTLDELSDMRISVMLSQIKPHFLFNTLTGITELQDSDPKHAKEVTLAFADYLRGNMLSVTMTEPVSFSRELAQLKDYVVIEKMRFGERLTVVYEIQTEDFVLPPMTLQPVVENAIRHGLMAREEGGTIWIRSYEDRNNYYVEVQDNGVGFDTNAPLSTDRAHVGVANIRDRLMKQCGGKLVIASTPGEGTSMKAVIPKEDKNENLDN